MNKVLLMTIGLLVVSSPGFAKPKMKNSDNFQAILSSNFDFNETDISGEMKAPDGFFLQGRKSQSLSQMVKLRADFRKQLIQSKTGVKAFIK